MGGRKREEGDGKGKQEEGQGREWEGNRGGKLAVGERGGDGGIEGVMKGGRDWVTVMMNHGIE